MSNLTLRFKRLHPDAVIPTYATPGSAGLDLVSIDEAQFYSGQIAMISTGLAVAIPPGFEGTVRPRSGLAAKHGITVVNTPGTIDCDYRGEIKVLLTAFADGERLLEDRLALHRIHKGDRIAQLVISPIVQPTIEIVDELDETQRGAGGFGSTGV